MERENPGKSKEDYLEAILMVINEKGACRLTDLANQAGHSKASASNAVRQMEDEGLVCRDDWRILLTERGMEIARRTLDKHTYFKGLLLRIGVDEATAEAEACNMEHDISDDTFRKMVKSLDYKDH